MQTHPLVLEFVNNTPRCGQFADEIQFSNQHDYIWQGVDIQVTIIDGDLPGYGLYVFFQEKDAAMAALFKLTYL